MIFFTKKFKRTLILIGSYLESNYWFWNKITSNMFDEYWKKWQLWPKNVSSKVFLSLYYFISTLAKKVYEKKPVGLFQISLLEIENKFKLWLMPIFSLFSLKSCQEQNSKLEKKQLGPLPMQHLEVKIVFAWF